MYPATSCRCIGRNVTYAVFSLDESYIMKYQNLSKMLLQKIILITLVTVCPALTESSFSARIKSFIRPFLNVILLYCFLIVDRDSFVVFQTPRPICSSLLVERHVSFRIYCVECENK